MNAYVSSREPHSAFFHPFIDQEGRSPDGRGGECVRRPVIMTIGMRTKGGDSSS